MKKYKLTDETKKVCGHILHRIKAVRDFDNVEAGDLGGFIEKEENLSHEGNCWVSENACVYEDAKISDDALIYGDAEISDDALIYRDAQIGGHASVYGYAEVHGNARVSGNARVGGNSWVGGNARVGGSAQVCGNSWVGGNALVGGNARVGGNSWVGGNALVDGNARIYGDAMVCRCSDYIVFKNWCASGRYFTWTRSNDMWSVGGFYGTGEELIAKAYRDNKKSGREYERIVKYVEEIKNERI